MTSRQFVFGEGQDDLQPIGDLLTRQALRDPYRPAVTIGDVTVTRLELERGANRWARAFAELGVGEGDFVSIVLPNSIEFHEVTFALWKLGATPAPISPNLPPAELQPILDLTQPRLVLGVDQAMCGRWRAVPRGFEPSARLSDAPLESRVSRYWKATTSGGSTGRPKVIVDHAPGLFDPLAVGLGMQPDDIILNPGPLYHNAPFGLTHRALARGVHVVEMPRFDPREALRLMALHGVRWVYMVPTMMNRIWSLPESERLAYDLSALEMVVHMAGACPVWLKQNWVDWLGPDRIWEVYAGTEKSGGTAIGGRDWLNHKGSVGRPTPGYAVNIIGEGGEALPVGQVGEIYFAPLIPKPPSFHYLGADEMASRGDAKSYGDMGYLDEDGFLYLADRRTDMIVAGGANIYPAEIESALNAFDGVASSVVVGLPDDDFGQRAHAIIEPADHGSGIDAASLAAFLDARLTRYKHPYTYELVDFAPHDDAGKVRRSGLRDGRIALLKAGTRFDRLRP